MVCVGGSVAVSGTLTDAPLLTAQALRYGAACLLLLALARLTHHAIRLPRGTEWLWLLGVATTGLVLFIVGLVRGSAHAEPAALAVAVAPVLLALLAPLLELTLLGVVVEGPAAVTTLATTHRIAVAYLALVVTAFAFVLWYCAVGRLGSALAGLLTGVAPLSAAAGRDAARRSDTRSDGVGRHDSRGIGPGRGRMATSRVVQPGRTGC